jgi:flagellar protein FlgJ
MASTLVGTPWIKKIKKKGNDMESRAVGLDQPIQPQYDSKKQNILEKACKEFESIFTYELLKSMRRTVEKCELFHGGLGEEVYESLLDMEISKYMAGLGKDSLTNLLYEQLKPLGSPASDDFSAQERMTIEGKEGEP